MNQLRALRYGFLIVGAVAASQPHSELQAQSASVAEPYRGVADRLIDAALRDSSAYERLSTLVDRFGHRLSGSENLERAIDWILDEMRRMWWPTCRSGYRGR